VEVVIVNRTSVDAGEESADDSASGGHTPRTDGGEPLDPTELFTRTADVATPSRRERLRRWYDAYLRAPGVVAWNDRRTRVGALIILYFLFQGTVGVVLTARPSSLRYEPFLTPFHDGWLQLGGGPFGLSLPFWPVLQAPLGTDITGKSLLNMLVYATPAMLKMIAAGALFSVVLATLIGTLSGYKGGRIDGVLMSFTDVVLTIPGLALILVIAAVFPPKDPYVVGLILGIDNWPGLARTIRAQVLSIREESFVEADRIMGLSNWHVLRKDFISQLMPYISINFANSARRIIFESVGLYFLGVLPFTTQNWGVIMNLAFQKSNLTNLQQLHWLLLPMLQIGLLSLGLILFSQGLDRVFNVRLRARHEARGDDDEDDGDEHVA
jgi:peptide/nickel transport system permease protein